MYLMRLDDACEHWNKENWHRMHDLLTKYRVKPIIAIIPKVEDPKLLEYPIDSDYSVTVHQWINEGWIPALHGFNHILHASKGGLNPVNNRSEFVGLSLDEQVYKIKNGLMILREKSINPKIFIAPAHTFDKNTLLALKQETEIRVISDTIADDVYWDSDFYYIPQQSGRVRLINSKIVTFCYHPNIVREDQFDVLDSFLNEHSKEFVDFENINLKKREKSLYDKFLSFMYFARHKTFKRNN